MLIRKITFICSKRMNEMFVKDTLKITGNKQYIVNKTNETKKVGWPSINYQIFVLCLHLIYMMIHVRLSIGNMFHVCLLYLLGLLRFTA